jgi:hypothetical chaperone protein
VSDATLAIDFGTSNSAAAILEKGAIRRVPIEAGGETLPTAVFFPAPAGPMAIGTAAAEALIAGEEGRYMRALKSVLGTALFHEPRLIGGRRRTLAEIVRDFLAEVKRRAETATGRRFTQVLSGRPVHFHDRDAVRDTQAETDLRDCYHAAGFETVAFMLEPEAAALASHDLGHPGDVGLIVDIGGGTSDFSVFRTGGSGLEILASHGIRLGGTDFDRNISMALAMPRLGRGGELRREFGDGLLPVPNAIFGDLATWSRIPFLYTPEIRRMVAGLLKLSTRPDILGRLDTVVREELGHELAFAVERGKIAANGREAEARIAMGFIAPGLGAPVSPAALDAALSECRGMLREAITETLRLAGAPPEAIGTVILVGGSSLMTLVAEEARAVCRAAETRRSQAFTAVVDGLALALAR